MEEAGEGLELMGQKFAVFLSLNQEEKDLGIMKEEKKINNSSWLSEREKDVGVVGWWAQKHAMKRGGEWETRLA